MFPFSGLLLRLGAPFLLAFALALDPAASMGADDWQPPASLTAIGQSESGRISIYIPNSRYARARTNIGLVWYAPAHSTFASSSVLYETREPETEGSMKVDSKVLSGCEIANDKKVLTCPTQSIVVAPATDAGTGYGRFIATIAVVADAPNASVSRAPVYWTSTAPSAIPSGSGQSGYSTPQRALTPSFDPTIGLAVGLVLLGGVALLIIRIGQRRAS